MALAPAGAFLVSYGLERGLRGAEVLALALAFAAPMITRAAGLWLMLPLGMIAVTLLLVVVVRRGLEPQPA